MPSVGKPRLLSSSRSAAFFILESAVSFVPFVADADAAVAAVAAVAAASAAVVVEVVVEEDAEEELVVVEEDSEEEAASATSMRDASCEASSSARASV
jgi:hypothetical protein